MEGYIEVSKQRLKSIREQLARCRVDIAAFTRTLVRATRCFMTFWDDDIYSSMVSCRLYSGIQGYSVYLYINKHLILFEVSPV